MRSGLMFISAFILSLAAGLGGYSLYNHWFGDAPARVGTMDARKQGSAIGNKRPNFSSQDINGNTRSISEWDGQVVLINFWATWCPPCRREIPVLVELHRELQAQGFSVIGAAIDNMKKVQSYVSEYDVPYPNLVGEQDLTRVSAVLGNTSVSLPYTVILGRDGRVAYTHLGEIKRQTVLDHTLPLLQEKGPDTQVSAAQ